MKASRPVPHANQSGFTFMGLLVMVALMGIALTAISEVWFTTAQRQRAEQSQWAAQEMVRAIGSYYESGPGGVKRFPTRLEDTLEDRRGSVMRRHLKQIYLNPETGKQDWEMVPASGGGIQGIKVRTWDAASQLFLFKEFVYVPMS